MDNSLSRREFLKLAGGLGAYALAPSAALPAWMPRMAFAPPGCEPQGDLLLVVFQRGGMDGLSAVIPHGDPHYYRRRSALAIAEPESGDEETGLDLDGFFGLHPALRPPKDLWGGQGPRRARAPPAPPPAPTP